MKKDKLFNDLGEMKEKLLLAKKELFNLRFQKAAGELKNTSRFKLIKKSIARIMTQMNSK